MLTLMNEEEKTILESLRFRDEDQSQKSGAILAFSGLMIATSTVQLSSSPESILYIHSHGLMLLINKIGIVVLFISSFISLIGMTLSSKYPNNKEEALRIFSKHVSRRANLVQYAIILSAIGSVSILVSFLYALFYM
ncbi:MAG: hypothetical protein B7C24_02360 [Bacteroidetes bacterium 4572_77]|nr:MAG: hypothetical protein B7C24_02360 [Bacteroidetes bacterium 4572_77]